MDNHIYGLYDYRAVIHGGSENRFDRVYDYDCEGDHEQLRAVAAWQTDTSTPPVNWENWRASPPAGLAAGDLVTDHTYLPNGNLQSLQFSGGDDYPDGAPAQT